MSPILLRCPRTDPPLPSWREGAYLALHRFQASDTIAWFEARGVPLKTEEDGRMFPVTDSSQTIIDCLMREAKGHGSKAAPQPRRGFCSSPPGRRVRPDAQQRRRDVLRTGCSSPQEAAARAKAGGSLAGFAGSYPASAGPIPLHFPCRIPLVERSSGCCRRTGGRLRSRDCAPERGPLLVTHWGLSGPAILRLSAWGARELHGMDYNFPLHVNWLPAGSQRTGKFPQTHRSVKSGPICRQRGFRRFARSLWEKLVAIARVCSPKPVGPRSPKRTS